VKTRCCRSTPRCAGCPVLLLAARRRQAGMPDLFAEILGGRTRALPESVRRALAELERRPERTGPPGRFERTRAADPADSGVAGVAVAGASCSPDEPEPSPEPDPWPAPPSSGHGWPSRSPGAAS
jgi:hypothetical protein